MIMIQGQMLGVKSKTFSGKTRHEFVLAEQVTGGLPGEQKSRVIGVPKELAAPEFFAQLDSLVGKEVVAVIDVAEGTMDNGQKWWKFNSTGAVTQAVAAKPASLAKAS